MPGSFTLRSTGTGKPPTLAGHFAVFNEWVEIDSIFEGHFMERLAPGCLEKTMRENRERIRCLFEHGQDPSIGNKVMGPIAQLEEDETGGAFEVTLLDTSYTRDLLPGLEAGLYGCSFRFQILKEEFIARPARSTHNPQGIPERTLTEIKVKEFGPVTFPAYAGASAGVRSLTDEFLVHRFAEEPGRLRQLVEGTGLELVEGDERRDSRTYERTSEAIGEAVWAIHPAALATIIQIIGERRTGYQPTKEEIRDRIGARAEPQQSSAESVAVIPISGPIFPKANLMTELSGATSVENIQRAFRTALTDENTSAIVFDIDSPGGVVDLIPELAAEIFDARGVKPIVAVANTMAASGAYWIASACDELIVTHSGEVGSVGVYTAHDDISAMQAKMGVKTTLVSAGKYKVEGNPYEPLSKEAQAEFQRRVDAIHRMFVGAVAKGRGKPEKTVLSGFGEGRMVMAEAAVAAGMADRVATLDQTITRLEQETAAKSATTLETSTEPELPEAATPPEDEEPEPSAATTHSKPEPGPSAATTRERRDPLYSREGRKEKEPPWRL